MRDGDPAPFESRGVGHPESSNTETIITIAFVPSSRVEGHAGKLPPHFVLTAFSS